jgi:flavodoxin
MYSFWEVGYMWKKIAAGLLVAAAFMSLTACGSASTSMPSQSPENSQAAANNEKVLVVYFSSSGNTKRVAETIADQKNGEIFEINPTQPYTDKDLNYRDDSSRVVQEHAQKDLRPAYEGDVADWNSYDTIYIGYPLWWQQAPPVVYTFVEHHLFQGKKVIPFCTSSSSPLGTSGKNLAQAAGSGDWQEGVRFSGGASKNEVLKWLKQQ